MGAEDESLEQILKRAIESKRYASPTPQSKFTKRLHWSEQEREIWKLIKGYNGYYSVSNYGRVRRNKYKKRKQFNPTILSQYLPDSVTAEVTLGTSMSSGGKGRHNPKRGNRSVAKLVWEAFGDDTPYVRIVQKNKGNKFDCRIENLKGVKPRGQKRLSHKGSRERETAVQGSLSGQANKEIEQTDLEGVPETSRDG